MKEPTANVGYDPSQFLKCPSCHRTAVTMTMHQDGDVTIQCDWCKEQAFGKPLNTQPREYK